MAESERPASPTAIVAAGDEETRVLLRGLLRLHHFRVVGEAEGSTQALALIRERRPGLLVTDVSLAEGSAHRLIIDARASLPTVRVVLVAPVSRPPPPSEGPEHPDAILLRPFRIRQFAEALNPPSAKSADSPTTPGAP
jgi:DNA-binding NarL/FixJ family response regulator